MSTSKHIDRICAAALVLALILTLLLVNGEKLGLQKASSAVGYETRLFDTSCVHTVDLVMDDWDGFLESCADEEYVPCTVVIDGERFQNVGIRAKGNTSLSTIASSDSDRYSFKLEFDHYNDGSSYYGLDKLCLNNLIQDNTMMKDYLVYRMMADFGVAAPLCSYVFITVNGEDWGLYLAVEGIEDSFLQRNYGSDTGELYKPDSSDIGSNGDAPDGEQPSGAFTPSDGNPPSGDFTPPDQTDSDDASSPSERPDTDDSSGGPGGSTPPGGAGGFGGAGGGMNSDAVKLQYIDDDPDSYDDIFSSAKTDITDADETRLIASLKALSEGDVSESVDIETTLRYFVVHNFVCNGDSYTGSMVHNYYLYEKDGLLSMIPWDYNLAFGTFQAQDADSTVNADIDNPVDGGMDDRPMVSWIFSDETYTQQYHTLFEQFLDQTDFNALITETAELIAPYVERDPTKFCTTQEFEAGVSALQQFCTLRAESVRLQLSGSDETVDASGLTLSDMGTMDNSMGSRSMDNGMDNGMGNSSTDNSADSGSTDNSADSGGADSGSTDAADAAGRAGPPDRMQHAQAAPAQNDTA